MSFLVALGKILNFLLWILLVMLEFFTGVLRRVVGAGSSASQEAASAKRVRDESPPPPRHGAQEHQTWDAPLRYEDHHQSSEYPSIERPYPRQDDFIHTESRNQSRNRRRSVQPDGYPPPDDPPHPPAYRQPPNMHSASSYAPSVQTASGSSSSHSNSSRAFGKRPRLERKYSKIVDQYRSLEEVTDALSEASLESSNLIIGIDFTKSNEWSGKLSFNGQSLHHIGEKPNPYEQAISIIGQSLASFDEDNLIPCFGFGDASTHDQEVFSFYPDNWSCNGFQEALSRYRELVPHLRLSGPTSFAPIIEMAMTIVEQSGAQYHVLLIIADGQVTRSVDTEYGQLSTQERKTVDAIVNASQFPLSIVLVGVGDGPWDMMKEFDDNIPDRSFDNFQFVNFTSIMSKKVSQTKKETEFALAALMEIPLQYKATLELGILGRPIAKSPNRAPLPPPRLTSANKSLSSNITSKPPSRPSASSYSEVEASPTVAAPSLPTRTDMTTQSNSQLCPVCLAKPLDMAFGCGHQTCAECGPKVEQCPICRRSIDTRIRLY